MIRIAVAMLAALVASPALAAEWRPPEDYLTLSCDNTKVEDRKICEVERGEWIKDYRAAVAGDYQGQRNVASFLENGGGAVRPNIVLSCAWRIVLVKSGHLDLIDLDFDIVRRQCAPQKIGAAEREAAEAQARRIMAMIAANTPIAARPKSGPADRLKIEDVEQYW